MPGLGLYQPEVFFEHLDDVVAVARLFRDQRERDQPQVARRQHATGRMMSSPSMPCRPCRPLQKPRKRPWRMRPPAQRPSHDGSQLPKRSWKWK